MRAWQIAAAGLAGVLVIVVVLLFFASPVVEDIQRITVEDFSITGIEVTTAGQPRINGRLVVSNPSSIDIPIKDVTYNVVLNATGGVLTRGRMQGFSLAAHNSTDVPFSDSIVWRPSLSDAGALLRADRIYIDVDAIVHVDIPGIDSYDIPISSRVDVTQYVESAIQEGAPQVAAAGLPIAQDIANAVDDFLS